MNGYLFVQVIYKNQRSMWLNGALVYLPESDIPYVFFAEPKASTFVVALRLNSHGHNMILLVYISIYQCPIQLNQSQEML